jgi:hypothetical protein
MSAVTCLGMLRLEAEEAKGREGGGSGVGQGPNNSKSSHASGRARGPGIIDQLFSWWSGPNRGGAK